MKSLHIKTALRSAQRLAEGEIYYKHSRDPLWLQFIRKESSILLRRAFKIWLSLRFGRKKDELY